MMESADTGEGLAMPLPAAMLSPAFDPTRERAPNQIDVNEVYRLLERKNEINALDFNSIVWMDGDKEIELPQKLRDEWKFIGLSNCCFAELQFWNGPTEEIGS